jgi:hypothetical protein
LNNEICKKKSIIQKDKKKTAFRTKQALTKEQKENQKNEEDIEKNNIS